MNEESTQLNTQRSASSFNSYKIGRSQTSSHSSATLRPPHKIESNNINKQPDQANYNVQRRQKSKKAAKPRTKHDDSIGANTIIPSSQVVLELQPSSSDPKASIESGHLFQTQSEAPKLEPRNVYEARVPDSSYDSRLRRSYLAPSPSDSMQNIGVGTRDRRKRPRADSDVTDPETEASIQNLEERVRTLENCTSQYRRLLGGFGDDTTDTRTMIHNLQDLLFRVEHRQEQDRLHFEKKIKELRDNFNGKMKDLQQSID